MKSLKDNILSHEVIGTYLKIFTFEFLKFILNGRFLRAFLTNEHSLTLSLPNATLVKFTLHCQT